MTEQKQPDALRLADELDKFPEFRNEDQSPAANELRRQHAEIESIRYRLDALEKQEPLAFVLQSIADGSIFKSVFAMVGWSSFKRDLNALEADPWVKDGRARIIPLYLAAGARPMEPVQKLRPDFIAGYDAGMADAKRIQAAQPAPAAVVGPTNKVLWLLMAQYGLNMTVGQDMDNLLNFGRDVWNAALSTTQPAPAAQADAASFKDAIITGTGITKDGIRFDPWSIYPNDNLLSIVRKIRACEGEAAALLVFETALKQHEPQPAPAVPTARVDAADSDTLLDLLADIDKHMRAEWDAGRLPASCWPTEFTQRIDDAHAQQKGGAK